MPSLVHVVTFFLKTKININVNPIAMQHNTLRSTMSRICNLAWYGDYYGLYRYSDIFRSTSEHAGEIFICPSVIKYKIYNKIKLLIFSGKWMDGYFPILLL